MRAPLLPPIRKKHARVAAWPWAGANRGLRWRMPLLCMAMLGLWAARPFQRSRVPGEPTSSLSRPWSSLRSLASVAGKPSGAAPAREVRSGSGEKIERDIAALEDLYPLTRRQTPLPQHTPARSALFSNSSFPCASLAMRRRSQRPAPSTPSSRGSRRPGPSGVVTSRVPNPARPSPTWCFRPPTRRGPRASWARTRL